jgi:hypothetical protein
MIDKISTKMILKTSLNGSKSNRCRRKRKVLVSWKLEPKNWPFQTVPFMMPNKIHRNSFGKIIHQ